MTRERDHKEALVSLAQGGGGLAMRELVRDHFLALYSEGAQGPLEDSALLDLPAEGKLAFTTDTFVVDPLFFPGGNVGDLAIHGTVNDLAMRGAVPRALSVAVVIEEGFALAKLREIVATMIRATRAARVAVVTGDTKVVARGQADGIFINTSGVGFVAPGVEISAAGMRPGDRLIVSGPIGDHGIAVLSRRAGLTFEAAVTSDSAPLADLVQVMLGASKAIHSLRDPTRGGLAAALNELAGDSAVAVDIDEGKIPVRPVVRTACETLGLDPLHVPCEGRLVAAVAAQDAEAVLSAMRAHPSGQQATFIGEVRAAERPEVVLHTTVGGARLVDLPAGELLPRIC